MTRNSFVFHAEWAEAVKKLPKDIRVDIYDAIIEYGLSGTVSAALKPVAEALFTVFRARLDADREKYEAKCNKLREAGRKGGVAKASKCYQMLANAKGGLANATYDIDNDIDIEKKDIEKKEHGALAPPDDSFDVSSSFLRFWEAYPANQRKTVAQRGYALRVWTEGGLDSVADKVMDALAYCKKTSQWQDDNFIPAASKWLRGKLWEAGVSLALSRAKMPQNAAAGNLSDAELALRRERLISTISALGELPAETVAEFDEIAEKLGKKTYKQLMSKRK